jgi:hypothetical protein
MRAVAPLFVAACLLAGCFPPLPEVPEIERVDAFCDADNNWNLYAEVTHPQGPEFVQAAWVEVGLAFYDENDEPYTEVAIGDPVDLLRVDGTEDEWGTQLPSDPAFIDCDYDFEYFFLFIAEAEDGNQSGRSIVN